MFYLISVLVVFLDLISKQAVLRFLLPQQVMTVTPFFNLVSVMNKGISFSLFNSGQKATVWALTLISLAIIIGVVVWLYREKNRWTKLALCLVLGGAVGNVLDRLRFGAVVDFLDFHIGTYHWPAFNVADTAVCIGVFIIIVQSIFSKKKEKKK